MTEIDSIELNLDTNFLERATVSLIREYLARKVNYNSCQSNICLWLLLISFKGYRKSLETFDEEYPTSENSLNSRSKLIDYLSVQKLYEKNKV